MRASAAATPTVIIVVPGMGRSARTPEISVIDLNLLVVFDAVMAELNVTRAAEKLSTIQPAVSKSLSRLRRAFKEDLFIKVPSGVKPTPKAIAIWTPIRNGLADIRQVTQPTVFDPATSTLTFTIALNHPLAKRKLTLDQFVSADFRKYEILHQSQ